MGESASYNNNNNSTRQDCIWRRGNERDNCPDPDITIALYTSDKRRKKVLVRFFISLIFVDLILIEKKNIIYVRCIAIKFHLF